MGTGVKQVVLITGANGMVATELTKLLSKDYSVRFLTRKVTQDNEYLWDLKNKYIDPKGLMGVNYMIHLAGASIANKRWSKEQKQTILSSRVDSGLLILEELKKHHITLKAFISASAVGYYGTTTSATIFHEESPQGNDFLSHVCQEWEHTTERFKSEKVADRVAMVRCGVILSKKGGALEQIVKPIKYGIGSGLGTGKQYMPWIHSNDLCGIYKFILEHDTTSGIYNAVSPEHTTNLQLTKTIAKILNRKLLLPNIPRFVLKALFGEKAIILLEGSRVSSDKIIQAGFNFKYKNLEQALKQILCMRT